MILAHRRMAAEAPGLPQSSVEPAPLAPIASELASRDARIVELEADNEALAEKLALCEMALGDVSEQLAAAQAPRSRAPRSQG